MAERTTGTAGRASSVKRKSLLSELGIQPESPKQPARTSTVKPKTPSVTRPSKTPTAKPPTTKSPVSKPATTRPSTTPTRKAPPAAIKTDRTTSTSSAASSPTVPKRKSMVPAASPSRASPLSRRASVNPTSAKRLSVGLAELNIKEKVSEQDGLLEQKIKEFERLKLDSEQKISSLENTVEELKKGLGLAIAQNVSSQETEEKALHIKQDAILETENMLKAKHQQDMDRLLEEQESKLKTKHQQEMEKLMEEQEKKLQSELSTLKSECEHMMNGLRSKNEEITHQLESAKSENEQLVIKLQESENGLEKLKERQELEREQQDKEIGLLNEKLTSMEQIQTGSYLRKVENELNEAQMALEEHKQFAQQQLEAIDKRHRDEIRQLQSGTDDTAMAWLEKTKATQKEVYTLHDELRGKEVAYSAAIEALRDQYEHEIEELREMCDEKDVDIEERSAQIDSLMDRVETLQNSLEAATTRLEHTAKSSPSSSSDREEINSTKTHTGHEMCVKRYEAKQKELNDLKTRLVEAKETHESQLNRLGQEKANAIQELQRTITQLDRQKPMTPPPSVNEDNLAFIVEQHKKEIKMMYDQYQSEVDTKNRELEDYAYRVKALVTFKQKETEKMENERKDQVNGYERVIEGYEIKIKDLDTQLKKYQERTTHWETLHNNTKILLDDANKGCVAHREENEQLLKLVDQLQVELHKV